MSNIILKICIHIYKKKITFIKRVNITDINKLCMSMAGTKKCMSS